MKVLPYPPGTVVHAILGASSRAINNRAILSSTVSYVSTEDGISDYHLTGMMGAFREDQLFSVFDNAIAALLKREVGK